MTGMTESSVLDRPGFMPESPVQTYRGFERNQEVGPARLLLLDAMVQGLNRRLSVPVAVEIRKEEGVWFVENNTLKLFGSGSSIESALLEFREHVGFFAERYLSLGPSDVIGEGTRLKAIYEKLLA